MNTIQLISLLLAIACSLWFANLFSRKVLRPWLYRKFFPPRLVPQPYRLPFPAKRLEPDEIYTAELPICPDGPCKLERLIIHSDSHELEVLGIEIFLGTRANECLAVNFGTPIPASAFAMRHDIAMLVAPEVADLFRSVQLHRGHRAVVRVHNRADTPQPFFGWLATTVLMPFVKPRPTLAILKSHQ